MQRNGSYTFGDLEGKLEVLRLVCEKCGREGRYRVDKLIEEHGRNGMLTLWREKLSADCPRFVARNYSDPCYANTPDLVEVFLPNGVPPPESKPQRRGWR